MPTRHNTGRWIRSISLFVLFFNAQAFSQLHVFENNGNVVVDNGIINAVFVKDSGQMSSLKYMDRELFANGGVGYIQMYSHEKFATPKAVDFSIYKQTDEMIDLSFKQDNEFFPFIVDVHYVVHKGFPGIYNYIIVEYDPERFNEGQIHQLNLAIRADPEIFTHCQVEDDVYEKAPTIAELKAGEMIMDATIRLGADSEYAKQGDSVYTKYNLSAQEENHLAHGWMGEGIGLWILQPDRDHLNGGPAAQELSLHQTSKTPILLRHFTAGHYGSGIISLNRSDGNWKKIGGPWVLYVNSDDTHEAMWKDAKTRAQTLWTSGPLNGSTMNSTRWSARK